MGYGSEYDGTGPDAPQVVVGADGTATALRAVGWAATEARSRGGELRIVHAAPYTTDATARQRAGAILARARGVAAQREPDVAVTTGLLDERPVDALVGAGAQADLLVVGMVGERLGEIVLGSVALGVTGAARCPVVVVRGGHRGGETSHPVLLGTGDVADDAAAVEFAFADAERHGTRLHVVHVRHAHADEDQTYARLVQVQLGPWRERYPTVPVDVTVAHDSAAEALLQASSTARVVVVGNRGRGPAARTVLGSTSRAVVRHAHCPVAVVPRGIGAEPVAAAPGSARARDPHDRSQLW